MNIREEKNDDDIQEIKNYNDSREIKDSYVESQIPTFNSNDLQQLLDNVSLLDEAIKGGDIKFVCDYFKYYSKYIKETDFAEDVPVEYIEFILPYIDGLVQIDTCEEVLSPLLLSVYNITINSHYYSSKFAYSPLIQHLLSIIQAKITNYITGLSINIIYCISNYDELHDVTISYFPLQMLFGILMSEEFNNEGGYYVLAGVVNLISIHLHNTTDDQNIQEIFNLILQYMESNEISIITLDLISIISIYVCKSNGRCDLPKGVIDFISNHLLEIIKEADEAVEDDLFYLLYFLIINNVEINYPVEDLYQYILDKDTKHKTKEKMISILVSAIKTKDSIEYTQNFITKSLKEVIDYAYESGTVKCKNECSILLGAILTTDNYDLFISILHSQTFTNYLEFIEISDDDDIVIFGVGIIGSAFHYLLTTMPDSDEIKLFLSTLLNSNLSEHLEQIAKHSYVMEELYIEISSLINVEASRLFPNSE